MSLADQSESHSWGQDPVRPRLKWAVRSQAPRPQRSTRILPEKILRLSCNPGGRQYKLIPD